MLSYCISRFLEEPMMVHHILGFQELFCSVANVSVVVETGLALNFFWRIVVSLHKDEIRLHRTALLVISLTRCLSHIN